MNWSTESRILKFLIVFVLFSVLSPLIIWSPISILLVIYAINLEVDWPAFQFFLYLIFIVPYQFSGLVTFISGLFAAFFVLLYNAISILQSVFSFVSGYVIISLIVYAVSSVKPEIEIYDEGTFGEMGFELTAPLVRFLSLGSINAEDGFMVPLIMIGFSLSGLILRRIALLLLNAGLDEKSRRDQ